MKHATAENPPAARRKPLRLVALLCVVSLTLAGCARVTDLAKGMLLGWIIAKSDDHLTFSQAERLILENKEALEADIAAGRAERWAGKLGIQSVRPDAEGRVDFDCGAWGVRGSLVKC